MCPHILWEEAEMNLTLSIEPALIEKARKFAAAQGISLNDLIRRYLRSVTGECERSVQVERLLESWDAEPGRSGGAPISRDEIYQERLSWPRPSSTRTS
jgi:hypothetical protein